MNIDAAVDHLNTLYREGIIAKFKTEQFAFSISDKMIKLTAKESTSLDGKLFEAIKNLALYTLHQAQKYGWLPVKLVYFGYFKHECPEENGIHKFYWLCYNLEK